MANSSVSRSLLIKLAMLATAVVLVLWIGWPWSSGPEGDEPGRNDAEDGETPAAPIPLEAKPAATDVATEPPAGPPSGKSRGPSGHDRLDLNEATEEALQTLPGVGPVLAARIVERRVARGPFRRVEELQDVKGIGRKRVEQLRPWVRVGTQGTDQPAQQPALVEKGRP
jgi:competence protein ComEA